MARGDVLVLMNNDVVVTPGWLDGLAAHTCDPGVGLVGPVTNQAPNEAAIPARYRTFGQLLHHAARQRAAHRGEAFDISVATMFCVALRREVFARIGALDEQFGTGLFEGIPSPFAAARYHSLAVRPEGFPQCLQASATAPDATIQGLRHRVLPIHGVQFHPESIATDHGHLILDTFLYIVAAVTATRQQGGTRGVPDVLA